MNTRHVAATREGSAAPSFERAADTAVSGVPLSGRPRSSAGIRRIFHRVVSISVVPPIVSLLGVIGIWYAVVLLGNMPTYILPRPDVVLRALVDMRGPIATATVQTLEVIVLGFAIACGVAMPLGIGIAFSGIFARFIYPPIVAAHAIPAIALAPLFLVWFGFGIVPKIVIAALITFFPVLIGTVGGLVAIDPDLIRLARVAGASRIRVFRKIRVPCALPEVFDGLKVGMTLCVIGAVVGEFTAGTEGLGYLIQSAEGLQEAPLAFATIVVLAGLSLILFYLVIVVERLCLKQRR